VGPRAVLDAVVKRKIPTKGKFMTGRKGEQQKDENENEKKNMEKGKTKDKQELKENEGEEGKQE
jgi:hypothetical protein